MAVALTVAGSDSGGGAGIQADIKTFSAFGVFGCSVITAVTAQNTTGVTAVHDVPAKVIAAQLDAVLTDFDVCAAKTGMLSTSEIIRAVVERLRDRRVPDLVVDPVMVAKSGAPLLQPDAVDALRTFLLPLARVVTPNIPEAEVLAEMAIHDEPARETAARRIASMGPAVVVIKGGHLEGAPVDLVWDGDCFRRLEGRRIPSKSTHGTGCTFSAAIAACLARGRSVDDALSQAKEFVTDAIAYADPRLGHGHGPLNHHFRVPEAIHDR